MAAYYNENDKFAGAWLRELIKAHLIADGEVDERSIVDVQPDDLRGFVQCHFFAGIGGWSYALRLAGWPDDRPVWTGSCPCQPWSVAGKNQGADDSRDLWEPWFGLIKERRPPVIFGEQVTSAVSALWLDRVYVDLEASDFAVWAGDLPAAGIGAPMLSQRLHFVAEANDKRPFLRSSNRESQKRMDIAPRHDVIRCGADCERLAQADRGHEHWWSGPLQVGWNAIEAEVERGGRRYRAQWRIKPGLSLLADGIPRRVELLRGYGNAIVPELAAEVIAAYMEIRA